MKLSKLVNMRGKIEIVLLLAGLLLFISDLVTDIFVAEQYWSKGEYWWFGLTLLFVIVSNAIVSLVTFYQVDKDFWKNQSWLHRFVHVVPRLFWPIVVRYVEEFQNWRQTYWVTSPCVVERVHKGTCTCRECKPYRKGINEFKKSQYCLATVHYVETLTESAPQWCLQIYIMLRQWDFPDLTVYSTVISLISLAWSITTLEKTKTDKSSHFTLPATVVYFTLQLFSLLSRVFAIVGIAYVSKEHVIIVLALHWLIVQVILMWANGCKCDEIKYDKLIDKLKDKLISFIIPFLFLLHVPEQLTPSRTIHFVLYTLLSVENVLLATLAVTIPIPDVKHMSLLRPLVLLLVTISVVIGSIFYIVYNKFFIPPEEPHKSDEEERTDQTNKSVKADEPHKYDKNEQEKTDIPVEEQRIKEDKDEPHKLNKDEITY